MPRAWMDALRPERQSEYFESCGLGGREPRAGRVAGRRNLYPHASLYTGALYTDIDLIDLTEGIDAPARRAQAPGLAAAQCSSPTTSCAGRNDLFSLQKERAHRDMHNLALVLHHHEGITEQAAVDRVARLIKGAGAAISSRWKPVCRRSVRASTARFGASSPSCVRGCEGTSIGPAKRAGIAMPKPKPHLRPRCATRAPLCPQFWWHPIRSPLRPAGFATGGFIDPHGTDECTDLAVSQGRPSLCRNNPRREAPQNGQPARQGSADRENAKPLHSRSDTSRS